MAERAATGGGTSLRGMRERMVAAAHAMAQERRNQSGFSSLPPQSSNTRSAFKPVIDGSVLKNDIKQKLAKERREERRRQQDATKEIQLLEKERKSKIQYEKQMEEKQRKLREQKQKDEQRRISAEEKRKQKLQEEREKFKAVVSRTLERSNRIEQRQKRWSWEGSTTVNSESKTVKKRSISTEKLEQDTSGSHKQMTLSSPGLQNSVAKIQQLYTDLWENDLIMRLIAPTKASLARSKSAASLSIPGKDTPGIHSPVVQSTNMPLLSHSNDELKNTMVLCKSTVAVPLQEKVEIPLKVSLEAPPEVSVEAALKGSMDAAPEVSVEAAPEASVEVHPEVRVEAPFKVSMEAAPAVIMGAFPEMSGEPLLESLETSPEGSEDMSLMSVDPSPEVSMDSSSEVSLDSYPEVSMKTTSEARMEVFHKVNMEMIPEESLETVLEENMEVPPKASVGASPESKSCPEVNVRDTPQKSNLVNKKRTSTHSPLSKWPSSTNVWDSPSPISANRQIQKNCPPSVSPVVSKQSAQSSVSCKIITAQHTLHTQSVLGTIRRRKKKASKKTTKSAEAVNQKHMTYDVDSGNKSTQGIMNAEEATKILAAKRRLAREHKEKEEKLQKGKEQRKEKKGTKKAFEGQEKFSKFDHGQQQKEIKKKEGLQDQENQRVLLQKGDAKIKAKEEADKRKKEQEKIMLQNLQERLERKKRIAEIMKRTRKTDSDTSKDAQTSSSDTYEEHEADDEDEPESDDADSSDDLHPSAFTNGMNSSRKLKKSFRNVKSTPRLLSLEVNSDKVYTKTRASLKSDMKNVRQKVKDPLAQAKGIRLSIKRMTNQVTKTEKIVETSNTMVPSEDLHSVSQECVCDQILDSTRKIDPLISSNLPDSQKHHLKGSKTFHQSPQTKIEKSDSA
ncbi:MAP7 domain-containing protein 3 isoform X1 [Eptesicus fuscus]|uniref:MAP7 domain-containing protein 3 isoform X1 n=1 Tax=Eptesicus fuscus TaxID=29078 RepID=UPI00240405F7|nr:MAP7 domain-containing protein 3 isoform X1 [Eptesicus fuscus]XP_054573588.1 MAP7 domain-containing protein 3 isoform X1 [Eptesicus fuscus]